MKKTTLTAMTPSQPAEERSTVPPVSGGLGSWLADRPWLFVVAAFLAIIGVWSVFLTLAIKHSPRDVLNDPLPAPASTTSAPAVP